LKLPHILLLLTEGAPIGQSVIWEETFVFISGQWTHSNCDRTG